MRRVLPVTVVTLVAVLLSVRASYAVIDPEEACQKARYAAAAKYSACEQKATSTLVAAGDWALYFAAASKCHVKYSSTWARIQAHADGDGTVCDSPRFVVSGLGVVIDNLTSLQWEMKTDDGGIHDKDDLHTWTGAPLGTAANGTAYTTFLETLNQAPCFESQCDWRLPTRSELLTILAAGYYCPTNPCIDPIFGPTTGAGYWTSTTSASFPAFAWVVDFVSGAVDYNGGVKAVGFFVRAVRGGL